MSARISIHTYNDTKFSSQRLDKEPYSYGFITMEHEHPGPQTTIYLRSRDDALRLLSELEALIHDRESVEMIG